MSCDSRWLSLMHTDMLKCVRGIIPARWSWWSFEFFTRIFQSKSVLLDLLRFLFEVYNKVYYWDVFRWLLWSKWEIFGCKIGQLKRLYLNCFPRHSLIFPVLRCQPFTLYYLGHFHHINVTPSGAHSSPDCLSFLHVTWIAAVVPTSVSFFLLLSEYSTSLFPVTFDSVVVRATPVWLSLYDEFSHFGGSSDYFILV